ncbi:MAG: penicillin acylase family protein [Bacteroidetes bacterium]|nr:MAG: penicillin acylase family protein [Bacteroidota bacterium]
MRKLLGIVLVVIVLVFIGGYLFVINSGTNYEFNITSSDVSSEVRVVFDDMAIPHIYADNETDAMFALGYVHASERLWQMDLIRRAGGGELSEIFGKDMIENDKYLRTLGMKESAEKSALEFGKRGYGEVRDAAEAYLSGVNSFIEEGDFPIEYTLLGVSPQKFILEDLYKTAGFMGYSFAMAFKNEPIIDWMKNNFDSTYMADISVTLSNNTTIPVNGGVGLPTSEDAVSISDMVMKLDARLPVPQFIGSNSWVISGEKTKSGRVVFANDAHMAFASPSVWYEAHIITPELEYYGNHLAGMPFPPIGHTLGHSWGITMFVNDDIDMYKEKIEGDKYFHDGKWLDLDISDQIIKVKDSDDLILTIKKTHHGPIIKDNISMWWAYTKYPDNLLNEAFYGFSRAHDIEGARRSASMIHAPGLNIMYGDSSGNIAWWASAKLPIRGDSVDSKIFIDGTKSSNDVQGWYDFSKNPQIVNPERGFVFSANNSPEEVDGVHYPGYYYSGNTRASSIKDALSKDKSDWTIQDVHKLQLRNYSPVYDKNSRMLVEYILKNESEDLDPNNFEDLYKSSFDLIKDWRGTHEIGEIAPTIYYRWMYATLKLALSDDMGEEKFKSFTPTFVCENTFPMLLENANSPWWDDINTEKSDDASEIVSRAFKAAIDELRDSLGDNQNLWIYSDLHRVTHKHAMGDVKIIGNFFNVGPFKVPSAKDALNKLEFRLNDEVNFEVFSGPSMRIAIDFSDVENSESVIPTGQSGNVFSEYYANQAEMYHGGSFRKQRMNESDIMNHAIGISTIKPEK